MMLSFPVASNEFTQKIVHSSFKTSLKQFELDTTISHIKFLWDLVHYKASISFNNLDNTFDVFNGHTGARTMGVALFLDIFTALLKLVFTDKEHYYDELINKYKHCNLVQSED